MASRGVSDNKGSTRDLRRDRSNESNTSPSDKNASNNKAKGARRFLKGTGVLKPPHPDTEGLLHILNHPLNLLLVFLPLGIAADHWKWGDIWAFWLNFVALVPMAKILGDATEELAANLKNDMLAGLLNATFGNAVEVVFTIQSLRAGLIRIVKATLLGSVLSNTLLVLGMSFFCGGIMTNKTRKSSKPLDYNAVEHQDTIMASSDSHIEVTERIQTFSMLGALVNTSMLLVSCLVFSLITIFRMVLRDGEDIEAIVLPVSRLSSVFIMMAYGAFIWFQLVTHREAMASESEDEEPDEDHLSLFMSLGLLLVVTIVVAYSSELLVKSIHGVTEGAHLSEHFIGIVLLPIVGNACEHAAAVRFAVQDKLGLSVSIAIGSSTQIALFVVPLSVLIGWLMQCPMDLNFGVLNSSIITLSVVVVLSMVVDGQSNWLQGYLLCTVYVITAVMFWYLPDDVNDGME